MAGRQSYTSNVATIEMTQVGRAIRDDRTSTDPRGNMLTTSRQIESWATERIQLNHVQEWALTLKTQHSELPSHEAIAAKWNEMTSALHSLVEKTITLNAQAQWEIGLFSDEYQITFKQGSKPIAEATNELAVKLMGLTNSLSETAETINTSISELLRLHDEVYDALATTHIQVQNELRQANFIGFKLVLGYEWKQKRYQLTTFALAGLKLLQETGFLVRELKTKVNVYQKNLDVLQASILNRQGIKKGKNRGLQVILKSFFSNNHPGKANDET